MSFTPEELEAMRLADEEIEREFADRFVAEQLQMEIDAWLDELAIMDLMDRKSYRRRKKQAAYYEAHKEEIAAKQAAYREARREKYNAYMRNTCASTGPAGGARKPGYCGRCSLLSRNHKERIWKNVS